MTDNVDLFADVAAALFSRLHVAFPVPLDIEIDVLADAAMPEDDPSGASREAFVEASLHWLGAAGLITFEPGQMGARIVERVGLTAPGFLALQRRTRLTTRSAGRSGAHRPWIIAETSSVSRFGPPRDRRRGA